MTSEEQKEEFEDILLEFHLYDISMAEAVARIEAALHSVEAEKEPEWISCEDRLPTNEDGDYAGYVWAVMGSRVYLDLAAIVARFGDYSHWKPTFHSRPAPPEHKPE